MRALCFALGLAAAAGAAAAEEDDEPRHSAPSPGPGPAAVGAAATPAAAGPDSGAEPSPAAARLAGGEDDPKLQRSAGVVRRGPPPAAEHDTPTLKLAYRYLTLPNLDASTMTLSAVALNVYPISVRWVRLGVEGELGFGSGQLQGKPSGAWYLAFGVTLGFQYPARVTPFLDARFLAGLIGGDVEGQSAVSWCYFYGLDAGAEFYVANRFFLSGLIGWVHGSYAGVVLGAANPAAVDLQTISGDAFTLKVGIGL